MPKTQLQYQQPILQALTGDQAQRRPVHAASGASNHLANEILKLETPPHLRIQKFSLVAHMPKMVKLTSPLLTVQSLLDAAGAAPRLPIRRAAAGS